MGEDRGPARFALWAAQPDKWTRGDASTITLHIDDGDFLLNLNGALALTPFPHFLGQIDGAAPSLRSAAQWLGLPLPLPGPYRDATLKGEASLDPIFCPSRASAFRSMAMRWTAPPRSGSTGKGRRSPPRWPAPPSISGR